MPQPLLEIDAVSVHYDSFCAVDQISFSMQPGELLGLVGPNGAGKTSILRAAAGLQPISNGRIRVFEQDVFTNPVEAGRHLAFTPDTPMLYNELTVEQFLQFIGSSYDLPASLRRERIDHWLDQLWLSEKRTSKIKSLSRGMRQRLAVARSLMPDPHVILLDEPAAGLDPAGRVQFRRLLSSLRDSGKALIVSSHILADLADYCSHILMMEHGRVLRYGTVHQVTGIEEHEPCRYSVRLAETIGDLNTRLAGLVDARVIESHGKELVLEGEHGPAAAAALLRHLIECELPVAEFRALAADLEQAYLRSGIAQVD
jgi:ABC-2 type transport system ATP-binding protein